MTIDYTAIKEGRKKTRRSHGINVGSVSLMMIFTILCLTIFAILTLISANAEYNLSEKYAASVSEYYENDYNAVEYINTVQGYASSYSSIDDIMSKVQSEADNAFISGDILYIEKSFAVTDSFEIAVILEVTIGKVDVISYKYNSTSDIGEGETNLNLWSGEWFE